MIDIDSFLLSAPHGAKEVVPVLFGILFGYIVGRATNWRAQEDAELLSYVEQAEVSVQCLPGINGDDPQWAVTSNDRVVGLASFEIRDAIRSAAGAEVTNG